MQLSVKDRNKKWNHCSDVALCKIEKLQTHKQYPVFWFVAKNEITYLTKRKKKPIMKVVWEMVGHLKVLESASFQHYYLRTMLVRVNALCYFSNTLSNCWQMYQMISSQNFKVETFSSILWIMMNFYSNHLSRYWFVWWKKKSPITPQHRLQPPPHLAFVSKKSSFWWMVPLLSCHSSYPVITFLSSLPSWVLFPLSPLELELHYTSQ